MVEYLDMLFDWDDTNDLVNQQKHGVSFSEAITVFGDNFAKYYDDKAHSEDESRFLIIGYSETNRILVVCHCYRESDTVTRIISARSANKKETALYGGDET